MPQQQEQQHRQHTRMTLPISFLRKQSCLKESLNALVSSHVLLYCHAAPKNPHHPWCWTHQPSCACQAGQGTTAGSSSHSRHCETRVHAHPAEYRGLQLHTCIVSVLWALLHPVHSPLTTTCAAFLPPIDSNRRNSTRERWETLFPYMISTCCT